MKGTTGRPATGWIEEHLKYSRKRLKNVKSNTQFKTPELVDQEQLGTFQGKRQSAIIKMDCSVQFPNFVAEATCKYIVLILFSR